MSRRSESRGARPRDAQPAEKGSAAAAALAPNPTRDEQSGPAAADRREFDFDAPVPLHRLDSFEEGDEVTFGRPETNSFAIFSADGAQLLRWLADGDTPSRAAQRYWEQYGEVADIADMIAALDELGFIRRGGHSPTEPAEVAPVRWSRLGGLLFGPPALAVYAAVALAALVAVLRAPVLVPLPSDLLFSPYYSATGLTLVGTAFPLITIHELAHVLAARQLGVRSHSRVSYRFYYLVVETSLDGLATVPRRKRYLPILAGMLTDCVLISLLVLAADVVRTPAGGLSPTGRVCLAVAFTSVIRVLWQFYFYMRTDVYALIVTALGCVDLFTVSRQLLANRWYRLIGRNDRLHDESLWHTADRRAARWYSWLILVGYSASAATFTAGLGPVFLTMYRGAFQRLGSGTPLLDLDSAVFLMITFSQVVLPLGLAVRDRLRRHEARPAHLIG